MPATVDEHVGNTNKKTNSAKIFSLSQGEKECVESCFNEILVPDIALVAALNCSKIEKNHLIRMRYKINMVHIFITGHFTVGGLAKCNIMLSRISEIMNSDQRESECIF